MQPKMVKSVVLLKTYILLGAISIYYRVTAN